MPDGRTLRIAAIVFLLGGLGACENLGTTVITVPDEPVAQCQAHPASIFPGYIPPSSESEDEEIFVVRGSRIARSDVNSENPVVIINQEQLINGEIPRTDRIFNHHNFDPPISEVLARQEAAARGIPYVGRSPVFRPDIETPIPATPSRSSRISAQESLRYSISNAEGPWVERGSISAFSAYTVDHSYYRVRNQLRSCGPGRQHPISGEMISHFSYDYLEPVSADEPLRSTIWLTPSPWSEETKLLHIGIRSFNARRTEHPPLNLVFLMSAAGLRMLEGGLGIEQFGLMALLDDLQPDDRISIVTYVPIGTRVVLEPTPVRNRSRIEQAILHAGNHDQWEEINAIETAYGLARRDFSPDQINHVIHSTGSAYGLGFSSSSELYQYIYQNRLDGIHFNTLRFGPFYSSIERASALAQAGDGFSDHIGSLREYRDILDRHIVGARPRVAENVSYQIEFNPAAISDFRILGFYGRDGEYEGSERVLSNHSLSVIYEITPTPALSSDLAAEIATLQLQYSLPGQPELRTIQRPIRTDLLSTGWDETQDDAKFAAATASFALYLQNGFYREVRPDQQNRTSSLSLAEIYALAESGLTESHRDQRMELLDLIELERILEGELSPY